MAFRIVWVNLLLSSSTIRAILFFVVSTYDCLTHQQETATYWPERSPDSPNRHDIGLSGEVTLMTILGSGPSLCCKQFLCSLHVSIQCLTCSKTSSDERLGLGRLVSMATTGLLGSYVYQTVLYPHLELPTNSLHSSEGSEFRAVIRSHCIRTLNFVVQSASGFLRSPIVLSRHTSQIHGSRYLNCADERSEEISAIGPQ